MRAFRLSPRAKYGNEPWYVDGRRYASKKEAAHAQKLETLKSAADPKERVVAWKAQVSVPLDVNGHHICNYIVDFEATYGDGRIILHEVKGFETPEWKLKHALFLALFPERPIRVFR